MKKNKSLKKALWPDRLPIFTPKWMRKVIEVNVYHIHQLMKLAQKTINPQENVLDAGSGERRFFPYLSHSKYIATDFRKGDINWNYGDLDVVSDLHNIPFRDLSIDNIVCTQVLEHVRNPERVVSEFGRVLKPGGKLFLSVPQSWHQHQKPHDYFRFTSFALHSMYKNAGLTPIFIQPMGGYFWFLSYQLQMMHFWIFPPVELGGSPTILKKILSVIVRIFFLFIVPIPLFYLDRLDRVKDMTMGYICYCIKTNLLEE